AAAGPPADASRRPLAVDQVAGETGAALQRARTAARRDRAEARPEYLPGDPDHPVLAEPRETLTPPPTRDLTRRARAQRHVSQMAPGIRISWRQAPSSGLRPSAH